MTGCLPREVASTTKVIAGVELKLVLLDTGIRVFQQAGADLFLKAIAAGNVTDNDIAMMKHWSVSAFGN